MQTRRAVGMTEFGGPEVLQVVEVPVAGMGPDDVLIRVTVAAVNPTDAGLRSGANRDRLTWDPPYVPGMDAAGTIHAVGAAVGGLAVGDHVMAAVAPARPAGGAYTELLTVPAAQVIETPDGATLEQAATLPMNGLTAKVVHDVADLGPGATFGVTGAAGVLGSYAIAIAKHRGLHVVADAAPDDAALVSGFGADEVVARGDDVGDRFRDVTDGGVDALLDAALLHDMALPGIRDGGHLISIRPFGGTTERGIRNDLVRVADHLADRDGLTLIRDLAGSGAIQLRVAGRFPPEQAPDAHRRFAEGGVRGRFLLTF